MFPFDSQRTDLLNRKTRVSKSCLRRILQTGFLSSKHASVKASRFDVIDHFYRGLQHILQRSNNHIFTATLQNRKTFYFARTSALVVVRSSSQNRSSSLMSPEWIYLTKTSNWAHEVKSVDSFTWKKNSSRRCFYFIYHLVFHIFRNSEMCLWTVSQEEIFLSCLPHYFCKKLFYCIQQTGFHKRFSNRASFLLGNFKCDFIWCLSYWGNVQQDSLSFQTRFMASEEFYNFLWGDRDALPLNTVLISKVSQTF